MPWKPSQPATRSQRTSSAASSCRKRITALGPSRSSRRTASASKWRGEVDPMAAAGEADLEPVVDQAFAPQPRADPGLVQQVDRALLENPGADPLLDVAPAVALQHDRVDAVPMQQLRQQQARRPGAD